MRLFDFLLKTRSYNFKPNKLGENNKNEIKDKVPERGSYFLQFIAGFTGSLAVAASATHSVWTSPALPHLKSKESKFLITDTEGVMIVLIHNIGEIVGSLLNPLYLDRIGRKYSLLLCGMPILVSWLLIIFAENYIYLLIARFFGGIGQGFTYNPLVIYLSEISEKNIRGTIVSIMKISMGLIVLGLTAIGSFLSYEILNLSCLFVPILFLVTFCLMPESPYYLLLRGKDEEAQKCLMKLRGISNPESLTSDIREMKIGIDNDKLLKKNALRKLISKSHNRKAFLIILCMKMTQLMTGFGAIVSYTEDIFTYSGSSLPPKVSVLILAAVRLISSCGASGIMDRISKRIIFLTSGILCAICLAVVGLFFFLKFHIEADVTSISWLPLVTLILYEISYCLGLGVIPYIFLGEIFEMDVKSTAVACSLTAGTGLSFVSTGAYSVISNAAGVFTAFWVYALVAVFGSILSFFIAPESNRRTLEEIQALQNPEMKRKIELERKVRSERESNP